MDRFNMPASSRMIRDTAEALTLRAEVLIVGRCFHGDSNQGIVFENRVASLSNEKQQFPLKNNWAPTHCVTRVAFQNFCSFQKIS